MPWKRYAAFAVGDLGSQFIYYWVTAFLMIFYTDVFIIPAAVVSILMLVVRLYDAIIDPLVGAVMDKTTSRWGRYRPWIFTGGLGLAISACFMFWAHPDWSEGGKIVYIYITYIVTLTFFTMFYMAYMALNACISTDSMVRARASSYRIVLSYVGMFLVGYFAPLLLNKFGGTNSVNAYLISIIIFAVIGFPLMAWTAAGSREVVAPKKNHDKISFRKQVNALFKNKPMLILLICMTVYGIQMNGRLTIATYYCTYVAGDFSIFTVFNSINSLLAVVGAFTAPFIYKFTKHKGKAAFIILLVCTAAMALQYFIAAPSMGFYILTVISGYCYGAFSALIFSMIPDAIDFAQYKFNVRVDGFLSASASFGFKVGGAVGTSIIGILLSASGYVANAVQNTATAFTINVLMTLAPAAMTLIAALSLLGYGLSDKKHNEILNVLQEKNSL